MSDTNLTDSGRLIIGATPIGNYQDASARLVDTMRNVPIILAEDTRTTLKLANRLKIKLTVRLLSLHEHNEASRIEQVVNILQLGNDVLLLSDAGMPLINDPGFKVVRSCIKEGITVTCLPGPSAPLTALVLSGLPVNRFCFEGFIPSKSGARRNFFTKLAQEQRTQIYLESPHRITKSLLDMLDIFGADRKVAVVRELTKPHEEVLRGALSEVVAQAQVRQLRGEICVCVAPSDS